MPPIKPKLVNRGPAGLLSKQSAKPANEEALKPGEPAPRPKTFNKIAPALKPHIVPIDSLTPDPNNARLHPDRNLESIMDSLAFYGQVKPVVVRDQTGVVMAGNGTMAAAKALGWTRLAAVRVPMTDAEAAGYGLADNRTAELARWDFEVVARLDRLIAEAGGQNVGWSLEELTALRAGDFTPPEEPLKVSLADRFGVPPFSVLDARQGYWQDRKRAWLALGIKSELGRGESYDHAWPDSQLGPDGHFARRDLHARVSPGGSPRPAATLGADGKTVRGDGAGKKMPNGLLGDSKQARSHYARTFGSGAPGELAAGFKAATAVSQRLAPGGGGGGCWLGGPATQSTPKFDNRAIKDHAWLATHGKGIPQMGSASPYGAYGQDDDTSRRDAAAQPQSGTSIFDPVLCELAYRWFCPPEGGILDPFAGGSVRGIVAAKLGRAYCGIELSSAQLAANEEQAAAIVPGARPRWVLGDALAVDAMRRKKVIPNAFDFLFSCPPYFDLERYSDDPRDLSAMSWEAFCDAYARIIAACCGALRDNRFACFCVGDIRDKKTGNYRGFVGKTIGAFEAAGCRLYNEAILVTAVGSLSIRVGKQFADYRKLGKTHQNVLVFVKGDWRKASAAVGPVEMGDVDLPEIPTEDGVADGSD